MMKNVNPLTAVAVIAVILVVIGFFMYRSTGQSGYDMATISAQTPKPAADSRTFAAPAGEHILRKGAKVDLPPVGSPTGQ